MDHDVKSEERENGHRKSSTGASNTAAATAALNAKLSRKRTKSGCLTCRKRRIKCGEERPICKNCVKSKRHCEGYNQRVVFKAPTFDYRPAPNGGAHITFQAGPIAGPAAPYADPHANRSDPQGHPHPARPPHESLQTVFDHRSGQYVTVDHFPRQIAFHPAFPAMNGHPHSVPANITPSAAFAPPQTYNGPVFGQNGAPHIPDSAPSAPPAHAPMGANGQPTHLPYANGVHDQTQMHAAQQFHDLPPAPGSMVHQAYPQPGMQMSQPWPNPNPESFSRQDGAWADVKPVQDQISPASGKSSRTFSLPQTPVSLGQHQWTANAYTPRPELSRPIDYQPPAFSTHRHEITPPLSIAPASGVSDHVTPDFYDQDAQFRANPTATNLLSDAAVEIQDDDYYDVASDEEMDVEDTPAVIDHSFERQRILGSILAMNQITVRDLETRRYDTFLYDGILDHYRVDQVANPLRNPATARVFAHFISATGPGLSIFDRHPRNTSVLFTEGMIPFSHQGIWTYNMPMAALRNQGLLHAMLALASLHIARLQGASETPSMQHYAWALKRIHHCVGHPSKRLKITTIAATMLLGFYEIMTADHMKWNMHLAGSRQLFVEIDFVKMTRKFRRMRAEKSARRQMGREGQLGLDYDSSQDDFLDQIYDVDERVISELIGREVRYDDHGQVETSQVTIPPEVDLKKYEILKDLYWWYCKQDAYQSIVSGNPLLMDFSRWANCPPRAPLGKIEAVYGSFDHLILLLGRIADFSSRDRERKLKQVEANGGQWRPAPGMNTPRPPQAQPPTPVSATNGYPPGAGFPGGQQLPAQQPSTPQFYGMAPPPRANVQMPSSYNPAPQTSILTPQSANPPDLSSFSDLAASTQAALEEYGRIRAALHTFQTSLGEAFEPLTSEYHAQMDTPFGPALFYRSYDIGCLWAIYNMAVIIAIRSHPHMPPAMHMAAAIAAQETAHHANEIGRIAAGIVPGPPDTPLNPSLGAALCESCMPSFFAAVQYANPQQRHDTVMRIYRIARRTGWGSAELIANGCETAWVKAAEAGRGPAYTRIVRPQSSDDPRLNGSWEKLDPNSVPNERDEGDRRLVKRKAGARLNWAIGILGEEEDVAGMAVGNGTPEPVIGAVGRW